MTLALALLACTKDPTADPTLPSSESDADTDADADADTDADTDSADSGTPSTPATGDTAADTGTAPYSPITGEWLGSCTPPYTYISQFDLDLNLVEAAGAVDGHGILSITQSAYVGSTGGGGGTTTTYSFEAPLLLTGTWDGVELDLALALDYYGNPSPLDLALLGTVSGTTWTGTLGSTVYPTTSYPPYPCTLERQ